MSLHSSMSVTHARGERIFTQLINISATVLPSLYKYALLAVKGIRRGLIHLHRLDCGNRHRSSREAGPRHSNFFCFERKLLNEAENTLMNVFFSGL